MQFIYVISFLLIVTTDMWNFSYINQKLNPNTKNVHKLGSFKKWSVRLSETKNHYENSITEKRQLPVYCVCGDNFSKASNKSPHSQPWSLSDVVLICLIILWNMSTGNSVVCESKQSQKAGFAWCPLGVPTTTRFTLWRHNVVFYVQRS